MAAQLIKYLSISLMITEKRKALIKSYFSHSLAAALP
jgi:hypothetical protein